jgi:MarR family transcriptional regulator, negative regulator of the multidrug operon emrRAB
MGEPAERLINLFGALALGVADRVRWAALEGPAGGGKTSAALVVIGHAPGLSIDQLGRVLGLSHPGAVRLVDRLATAGLAARTVATHDRRTAALHLTDEGQDQRKALLKRRREAIQVVLRAVVPENLAVLEQMTDAMLRTLPNDATSALTVCRFCDERQCTDCPMDVFGAINPGSAP